MRLILIGLLALVCLPARAAGLAELIETAKTQFAPLSDSHFEEVRGELVSTLDDVSSVIATMEAYDQKQWRDYLQLDRLKAQSKTESGFDRPLLQSVLAALYRPNGGIDLPRILRLRHALGRFVAAAKRRDGIYDAKAYGAHLAELAEIFDEEDEDAPTGRALQRVSEIYTALFETEQAKDLTDELHRRFGNANLRVRMGNLGGRALFTQATVTPVSQYSDGSQIVGQTFTQAWAGITFVPNATMADVRVQMQGTADTTTTAYRRILSVNMSARTWLSGWKRIGFDGDDILVWPATAACTTSSTVTGVDAGPIIRRIAYRKASALQPQAEAQITAQANAEVTKQLDTQVNKLLGEANATFHEKIRDPLKQLGFEKFFAGSATTSHEMFAYFSVAHENELGAPISTGTAPAVASDLAIDLHESAIGNGLAAFLSGQNVPGYMFTRIVEMVTGAAAPEKGDDDWFVVFDLESPVLVEIEDERQVTLEFRLRRFGRKGQTTPSVRLRARYRPDGDGKDGLRFARVGKIERTGGGALGGFIDAKMEELIRPEFALNPELFERLKSGQASAVELAGLSTSRGWLHAALRLKSIP